MYHTYFHLRRPCIVCMEYMHINRAVDDDIRYIRPFDRQHNVTRTHLWTSSGHLWTLKWSRTKHVSHVISSFSVTLFFTLSQMLAHFGLCVFHRSFALDTYKERGRQGSNVKRIKTAIEYKIHWQSTLLT